MRSLLNLKLFISCLFAVCLMTACNNSDGLGESENKKVNVVEKIKFKVNFTDYNEDEELQGTRSSSLGAGDTLNKQVVNLGNGLLALVTMQKDSVQTSRHPVTRALDNETYTMLAYKNGTLAGTVTGTVTGGVFTATSANESIQLTPDTYDFVLYNSKVNRSGDNLSVNRSDIEFALIGRTTYTVTAAPTKQQVVFQMKHAGARMRIKLTGYMKIESTTKGILSSVNSTDVPGTAVYNASTGVWSAGTGASISGNCTFPESSEWLSPVTYTSKSNEYQYFLPSTDASNLKFTFTGGEIYKINMSGASLKLSPNPVLTMKSNASYLVNIKLMYSFLYLFSDGSTGLIDKSIYGGGTKTPVGVVVSRSKRLAIALKNANNGAKVQWATNTSLNTWTNTNVYQFQDATFRYDGEDETWNPANNRPNAGTVAKGDNNALFPAFYRAGHYSDELQAAGISMTGTLSGKKWHLPAYGEMILMTEALGFAKTLTPSSPVSDFYGQRWYPSLADIAFTQAGGTSILLSSNVASDVYWTSTDINGFGGHAPGTVALNSGSNYAAYWSSGMNFYKTKNQNVRAFINY